jgi:hypothetical protein
MADYCSKCSPFDGQCEINLIKIALKLKHGHSESFICEGCNNRGIYKDENGILFLAKHEPDNNITLHQVSIEDLM